MNTQSWVPARKPSASRRKRAGARNSMLAMPRKRLHISILPDEILQEIFTFLSLSDIANTTRVSRKWHSVADDPQLWREVLKRATPGNRATIRRFFSLSPSSSALSASYRSPSLTTPRFRFSSPWKHLVYDLHLFWCWDHNAKSYLIDLTDASQRTAHCRSDQWNPIRMRALLGTLDSSGTTARWRWCLTLRACLGPDNTWFGVIGPEYTAWRHGVAPAVGWLMHESGRAVIARSQFLENSRGAWLHIPKFAATHFAEATAETKGASASAIVCTREVWVEWHSGKNQGKIRDGSEEDNIADCDDVGYVRFGAVVNAASPTERQWTPWFGPTGPVVYPCVWLTGRDWVAEITAVELVQE